MAGERWNFTKSQLLNTPSRKCGIDIDKELSYRQQAANLIQDMGQRLQTNQLCINTAIVYMHRFYMFHSFTKFNRNVMSPACLFLAAKVEEQPRKLEHVIKTSHSCLQREGTLDTKSETYLEYAQELIINENILLQTLGFEVRVDHPHTTVVTTCQLVRVLLKGKHQVHNERYRLDSNTRTQSTASKDLAQTSYFLATNSLHLTTMCLQYKPNVVACVCIHLACKWSGYEIPSSHEGKSWFSYVDRTVTMELLEELTQDFLNILDKCPSRLKKKIMVWKLGKGGSSEEKSSKSDAGSSSKSGAETSNKNTKQEASGHARNLFDDSQSIINEGSQDNNHSSRSQQPTTSSSSRPANDVKQSQHPAMTYKDYKHHKDRKERERMSGHHGQQQSSSKSHGNGDVKRSHAQHVRAADSERKATHLAYDSLHHLSREDPSKRHDPKRQHESPSKVSLKSNRDDKNVNKMPDLGMKVSKRPHQSDNEGSDGSERYSKHRRSETHPASTDNSFSTGTINHSDLFLSGGSRGGAQNMYLGMQQHPKMDSGSSGTTYKNKSSYDGNSDRSMWANVKSTKSPNVGQHLKIPSKKDRSIFSPPQPPSSSSTHRPPTPPHLLQSKPSPPPSIHMLPKISGHGNLNASFDQSYQHGGGSSQGGGGHSGSYSHPQYMYMQGSYPDAGMGAVQGMNSNGAGSGALSSANLNPKVLQAQLQHLIAHQEYEIAATQQKMQGNHESPMSAMFGLDLLESDLGAMPPLPPPLPQSNAPQPPPPPY